MNDTLKEIRTVIPTFGMLVYSDDLESVLLVKHNKKAKHQTDTYGIPAGRQDEEDEDAATTVLREFHEETGLTTTKEDIQQTPFYYEAEIVRKDIVKTFSLITFLCKRYEGTPKEMEENIPEWVKISELDNYNLLPNMKKVVLDGVKYAKEFIYK